MFCLHFSLQMLKSRAIRDITGGERVCLVYFPCFMKNLQKALAARQWKPTPIQESAIPDIIDGKE